MRKLRLSDLATATQLLRGRGLQGPKPHYRSIGFYASFPPESWVFLEGRDMVLVIFVPQLLAHNSLVSESPQ